MIHSRSRSYCSYVYTSQAYCFRSSGGLCSAISRALVHDHSRARVSVNSDRYPESIEFEVDLTNRDCNIVNVDADNTIVVARLPLSNNELCYALDLKLISKLVSHWSLWCIGHIGYIISFSIPTAPTSNQQFAH